MSKVIEVYGVKEVLAKLSKADKDVGRGIQRGLIKAGLFLLRESQLIVPVDLGNLKASGATRAEGSGAATVVWVVYTANYAVYVHENLDAAHGKAYNLKYAEQISARLKGFHSRGENQQAKFLEEPARLHQDRLGQIIHEEVSKV
jgi:hypothetical protein